MNAVQSNSEMHGSHDVPTSAGKSMSLRRILAAVDGSERTNGIVEFLTILTNAGQSLEVVVLNVQPLPENWRLRGYESFKREEVIDRLVNDLGKPIVDGAGQRLQKAGIAFTTRIEIGDPVDTIIRCSIQEGCGLLVLGDPRPGAFRRWLTRTTGISFGSVASSVALLSESPVVIAK